MKPVVEIETERLRVIALDWENLLLCRQSRKLMEHNLGLTITHADIEPEVEQELRIALEMMICLVEEDMEMYLWNTNWEIVLKEENRIIGGFCFQGCPDSRGRVQIGYVIQKRYQGKGYATEALKRMISWALSQAAVSEEIAETEKDNFPSQRALEKSGMKQFRETEHSFWWKK